MNNRYLLKLAYKNLMAHRMRSALTLIGIVIGISAVVFLVAFGFGIQRLVTEQITGADAFQLIDVGTGNSKVVRLDLEMLSKVRSIPGVKSVEVTANLAGKAKRDGSEMDVSFFAMTGNYLDWSGRKIRYGVTLSDENNDRKVVVNNAYLDFLGDKKDQEYLGEKVYFNIIVPKELSPDGQAHTYEDQEYTISGIVREDAPPSVYTNMSNIASFNIPVYSQAKIRVEDRNKVDTIRKQAETYGLKTQYVGDTVNQVEQVFAIFKVILASFGFIALLVALLGMFNTLTVSLLERVREVALMKILGINRKDIQKLFISEALILGVIGGVIGVVWGVITGFVINSVLNYFAVQSGGDKVAVFYYPLWFVILIVLIAILIGFVTGLYPARRARKVNALDVLRYE